MIDDGADVLSRAERCWRHDWQGESFMAIGTRDGALGLRIMRRLRDSIRNCPEPLLLDAGHYLQEPGEVVAQRALEHFGMAGG